MTTHYIIPCSAKKAEPPANGLCWTEDTRISEWKIAWDQAPQKLPVSSMYTGRSIIKSLEGIRSSSDDWRVWVVSAGKGLLRGPSSIGDEEDEIPSYDVHCFPSFPMTPGKMRQLWEGLEGEFYDDSKRNLWSKLDISRGDSVVVSLPISYQSAILPSLGEYIATAGDVIGIGSHLSVPRLRSLGTHPRIRETLGCGFSMMRANLLQRWISGGDEELERLDAEARALIQVPSRRRVSDEQLKSIISGAPTEVKSSISRTVPWVRHGRKISASESRIISALESSRKNRDEE